MNKNKKYYLFFSILFANLIFANFVFASGFVLDDFWLQMFDISGWVFLIGILGALISIIAGAIGAFTGKFKIKIYIPFVFLLITIISAIAPYYFPSNF